MLKKVLLIVLVFVLAAVLVLAMVACDDGYSSSSSSSEKCAWCGKSLGSSYKRYDGRKFCSESCKGSYQLKKAWPSN